MVRGLTALRRLALVPLVAWLAAGCGAAPSVPIPSVSPTPAASPTTIAPGVQVPTTEVKVPTYTVSTSHPLPSGVSAATVAQDVVIDNLIENVAIERGDAALLPYADCGNWLAAEQATIAKNHENSISVVSVRDEVTSMKLGFQSDPNDSAATAAVTLTGVEVEVSRNGSAGPKTSNTAFAVLQWLSFSTATGRYLTCDSASL